jgi:NAD(P)-dependent dehydrogenase (short-subunit alcohol dehydrogenase family)
MTRVWLITGVSRGLGHALAQVALAAGDRVIGTTRSGDFPEGLSGDLHVLPFEASDPAAAERLAADAFAKHGRIDVLVNNAGFGQLGFFETLTPEQIEVQYRTNVFGLYNVTRAVLPHMRAQRAGHILNISSIGGVVGFGGAAAYTSSKFAIEGFSEDIAIDLKPFGIHVIIVEPGFFRTDFLENSSVRYGEIAVDDYSEANAKQRETYGALSRKQLGDPKRLGQALLRIVAEDEPPLRFAAGSDAVKMTRDVLEKRLAELDRWQDLSKSTDSDA